MCVENPDILLLKVDFDENREVVKPLGIKVRCYFPHLAKMLHAHQLLNEVASLSCHHGCQLASHTHIDDLKRRIFAGAAFLSLLPGH